MDHIFDDWPVCTLAGHCKTSEASPECYEAVALEQAMQVLWSAGFSLKCIEFF